MLPSIIRYPDGPRDQPLMSSSAKTWHPDQQQLAAFTQRRLPDDERKNLQAHLDRCAACRQELARLQSGSDSLNAQETQATSGGVSAPAQGATAAYVAPGSVPADLVDHPRYEVLQLLGQGGMGAVYKARHKKMDRVVALKVINAKLLDNPKAVERFEREVKAAAKLHHPNIVSAHDADQASNTHFLVMEFVEGTDLAMYVDKKGPLPVAHACHCIRQAALGLQHAHEHGMVHRDIKPHNLMLTTGDVVKVMDFGLARLAREDASGAGLTGENVLMGTADYIAPEQAQDAHKSDIRADIYSLGCSLYHLLAGKPPFEGGTVVQKIAAHLTATVPLAELPTNVPEGLRVVLTRMVEKNPTQRYHTPAEVAQALVPFLVRATDAKSGESYDGKAKRARRFLEPVSIGWVVLGAMLLAAGVLALVRFQNGRGEHSGETAGPNSSFPPNKHAEAFDDIKEKRLVGDAWLEQLNGLPAQQQVDGLSERLRQLNPGFRGKATHKAEEGVVTELQFSTDEVTDIAPVRAMRGLRVLVCSGSWGGKGKLSDLSPLKGMNLTALNIEQTQVKDLSPLSGMKLTTLNCDRTQVSNLSALRGMELTSLDCPFTLVSDLSPIKGMPLTQLNMSHTLVVDLSPLEGMKITKLHFEGTHVSDLSPLRGMPLTQLYFQGVKVSDLSFLKDMPIEVLGCDIPSDRDSASLRGIKTLVNINGTPAKEFWKRLDVKKP